MQSIDTSGTGIKCSRILLRIRVLGYVDDDHVEPTVEVMTVHLTNLTNASRTEVDRHGNEHGQNVKTVSQYVHKCESIKVTTEEVAKTEVKYKFQCDFCIRKFKTK